MRDFDTLHQRIAQLRKLQIFFVVGASKSGTTWVQQLYDGHPRIICRGEGHFSDQLLPALAEAIGTYNSKSDAYKSRAEAFGYPADFPSYDGEQLGYLYASAIALALDAWAADTDIDCIGEKTPEHVLSPDQLGALFPECRFVHIIRDGRDAAASGWHHNLQWSPDAATIRERGVTWYVDEFAKSWVNRISTARAYGQAHPDRYLEIRYEELHARLEPLIGQMLEFLGADSSAASIRQCLEAGSFESLSKGRSRGEEDRSSFFRKGIIGDWKNQFDAEATEAFDREAGALLSELGYA
jgi:hypothetical protein